jgi:predicted porin
MFKKSAIAVAVAGIVSVPMAVQAHEGGEPTVYGFVNIGIENVRLQDGSRNGIAAKAFADDGVSSIIFAGSDTDSTHANDIANTRFGFKGSKDLGNGLTASYKIEIGTGTTSGNRGGPVEDSAPWDKRIAQIQFSGGFGSFTIGNQWGLLYEYLGYNVYRSDGHGGAAWYESTRHVANDAYGLRVSNGYTYTYGGGGYSADPFTFSVQAIMNPARVTAGVTTGDEDVDALVFAAAASFGSVTINGLLYTDNNSVGVGETELGGLGFRWNVTDALYLGGTLMTVDRDIAALIPDDAGSWNLVANYDFGGGFSGMFGIGAGETGQANGIGDMETVFLQASKSLGGGTKVYFEWETAERDLLLGATAEVTVAHIGVKQVF